MGVDSSVVSRASLTVGCIHAISGSPQSSAPTRARPCDSDINSAREAEMKHIPASEDYWP